MDERRWAAVAAGAASGTALTTIALVTPDAWTTPERLLVSAGIGLAAAIAIRLLVIERRRSRSRRPVARRPGTTVATGSTTTHRDRRWFLGFAVSAVVGAGVTGFLGRRPGRRSSTGDEAAPPPTEGPTDSDAAPAPAPNTWVVPSSIDATGQSDVGAELSAWLASAVDEADVILFAPGGNYRINDAAVVVDSAADVVLDFQGATLQRDAVIARHLRYPERHGFLRLTTSPENVTVRNLKTSGVNVNDGSVETWADGVFPADHERAGQTYLLTQQTDDAREPIGYPDGKRPGDWGVYCVALAFEHAVDIVDGRKVVVEDCELVGAFGDGVNTIGQATAGVTVRRVIVDRNGRQGITMVAGHDFLIHDCEIRHSRRSGIDLEPDVADVEMGGIEIRDNTVNSHLVAFASGGPGRIGDVWIHGNVVRSTSLPTLFVRSNEAEHPRVRWRFEDNEVISPLSSGASNLSMRTAVRMGNVHDSVIRGNTIPFSGAAEDMAGVVLLDGCTGITVVDNRFPGADHVVVDRDEGDAEDPSQWRAAGNLLG